MRRAILWRQNAGFTLVEALVATLLMSIIFAALATLTAQWLPDWNRGLATLQRIEVTAAGLDRLTDDLAAAKFVSAGGINDRPLFDGAKLSVTFVRSKLAPNAGPGLEVVRIAETRDDGDPVLVRSTAPLPTGTDESANGESLTFSNPVIVIRAPYRVSFSYAGPDRVWRDNWQGQTALPRAVRIQLRDNATSMLLAVSTSTLIHAELPARCTWGIKIADCPGLGSQAASANGASSGALGTQ